MPADDFGISEKQEIRRQMAALRSQRSESEAREAGLKIAERILALPFMQQDFGKSPVIALYSPIRREPDLLSNAVLFAARGFRIALPRVEDDTLVFSEIDLETVFQRGSFGIREPSQEARRIPREDICVMCLPGLAFDREGGRIGYGKGYYDRYLSVAKREDLPMLIGTGYDFQLLDRIPQAPSDRRAAYVITPSETLQVFFEDSFDTACGADR
jgi:5-formyltetrahydrofolate cyclo-ligase